MLADPWKKLQHVIERSEDNKNLQQTERHEEHVKEETEDKPGEQASQT